MGPPIKLVITKTEWGAAEAAAGIEQCKAKRKCYLGGDRDERFGVLLKKENAKRAATASPTSIKKTAVITWGKAHG